MGLVVPARGSMRARGVSACGLAETGLPTALVFAGRCGEQTSLEQARAG